MEIPICFFCIHKVKGRLKCAAFGDQLIPDEILLGKSRHDRPLPTQKNTFVFKPSQVFVQVESRS